MIWLQMIMVLIVVFMQHSQIQALEIEEMIKRLSIAEPLDMIVNSVSVLN